jgi:hypothetical protein
MMPLQRKRLPRSSTVLFTLLAAVACSTASRLPTTPPPHGTFTAASGCVGGNITFTLRNNNNLTSIRVHDRAFVVLDQSFQVVAQPIPGPLINIAVQPLPSSSHTWTWNQKTTSNSQAPVGTYVVVLAVEDDERDSGISPTTEPWQYIAMFKIVPFSLQCLSEPS